VEEKKRGVEKLVPKLEPRKRVEAITSIEVETSEPINEPKENKHRSKPNSDKYIRICEDASSDERRLITDKLGRGDIVFGYYAIDNDKGYHYYLILKK